MNNTLTSIKNFDENGNRSNTSIISFTSNGSGTIS